MKLITKAILEVMKSVKGVEKNTTIGTGNYSYKGVSDKDVKDVFNPAMSKAGLSIVPINIDDTIKIDRWEETYKGTTKTKQSVFTTVKVKYLLLHESGESIELMGYGHGIDSQDKSAGKATTYALKNCLLYTFLTPVGAIEDTDTTHSQDISTPAIDNRIEMRKGTMAFTKAKEALGTGEFTLDEIEKKYKVSDELKNELLG